MLLLKIMMLSSVYTMIMFIHSANENLEPTFKQISIIFAPWILIMIWFLFFVW